MISFSLPSPPSKSSHIPHLTVFQIHSLFSHSLILHAYMYIFTSLNITCSVCVMLLACVFKTEHLILDNPGEDCFSCS